MKRFFRRTFLRTLLGSAAWVLTQRTCALGRLIERGSRHLLETPLGELGKSWLTASGSFFVLTRTVPRVPKPGSQWAINVRGLNGSERKIRVHDLFDRALFDRIEFPACIQCAGYGRSFFRPTIDEIPWGHGAIGNAMWGGVRLADVLRGLGVGREARHVAFVGADSSPEQPDDFIKSIPRAKAMNPHTIMALTMNGEPLPFDHGGPVRMIVPGWIGAYSMKWLTHIIALAKPWNGHWMNEAYTVPVGRVNPDRWKPLTALAPNSVITEPADGEGKKHGRLEVRGFAWSGENEIVAVHVSTDAGTSWQQARLGWERAKYAWRRWSFSFEAKPGRCTVIARATDANGATQPIRQDNWNPGGYGWHAAHSIRIMVV